MKKFLEVLVDDDGLMHFSTDFEFPDSVVNPPKDLARHQAEMDNLYRRAVRSLVTEAWKKRNFHPSKAIRILSMAEILSCAQPYENAEEFWSCMMFDLIPRLEKFSANLKRPFGYDASKVVRPIKMDGPDFMTSIFPMSPIKS